jgi:hypothetical protein
MWEQYAEYHRSFFTHTPNHTHTHTLIRCTHALITQTDYTHNEYTHTDQYWPLAACESSMQRITEAFFKQLADVSKLQSVHPRLVVFVSPSLPFLSLFDPFRLEITVRASSFSLLSTSFHSHLLY